jgi:hypothetical protein
MNRSKLLGLLAVVAGVQVASAGTIYYTGYESPPFNTGFTLYGQDGWVQQNSAGTVALNTVGGIGTYTGTPNLFVGAQYFSSNPIPTSGGTSWHTKYFDAEVAADTTPNKIVVVEVGQQYNNDNTGVGTAQQFRPGIDAYGFDGTNYARYGLLQTYPVRNNSSAVDTGGVGIFKPDGSGVLFTFNATTNVVRSIYNTLSFVIDYGRGKSQFWWAGGLLNGLSPTFSVYDDGFDLNVTTTASGTALVKDLPFSDGALRTAASAGDTKSVFWDNYVVRTFDGSKQNVAGRVLLDGVDPANFTNKTAKARIVGAGDTIIETINNIPIDATGHYSFTTTYVGLCDIYVHVEGFTQDGVFSTAGGDAYELLGVDPDPNIPSTPFVQMLPVQGAPGDTDGDNQVSILDYIALSSNYEKDSTASDWTTVTDGASPRSCDIDGDLSVSILDYILLSANYEAAGVGPF